MSKRNKKYNPNKSEAIAKRTHERQTTSLAKNLVKDVSLIWTLGGKIGLINNNTNNVIQYPEELKQVFQKVPHKWSLYLLAFHIRDDGIERMEIGEVDVSEPIDLAALNNHIALDHMDLIEEIPQLDLVNVGWLATPSGRQFSPQEIDIKFSGCSPYTTHERGSISLKREA